MIEEYDNAFAWASSLFLTNIILQYFLVLYFRCYYLHPNDAC
jgi:hypothetical protein